LEAWRASSGEDTPDALRAAHNVATNFKELERYDEAESLLLATIGKSRKVLGDLHPNTCRSLVALGSLYQGRGRYVEAEPLLLSAYDGYARTFSPVHRDALGVVSELAKLYEAWGKSEKAKEWRAKLAAQPKPGANASTK
jgi:tetratricopeptide (TPR) repeat protein